MIDHAFWILDLKTNDHITLSYLLGLGDRYQSNTLFK